jgi:putative DNA primase/helicase
MSFAAILSRGGLWPDGTQAPVGDTLIWSGEENFVNATLPRYMAAGGVRERLHGIGTVTEADGTKRHFDPARDIGDLMAAIEEIPDLRYVVIDPVSVVVSAGKGASNNNAETRRALQPLTDLAKDCGIVVEGITHFSKDSKRRDVLERVIESTAFGAVPRVVHVAHKFEDIDKPRIWARAKGNNVKTTRDIGFEFQPVEAEVPGYPMRAPRIEWGEPAIGNLGALIAEDDRPEKMGKLAEATLILSQMLPEAPGRQLPSKEIKEIFHEVHGIGWSTVQEAKNGLPIHVFQNLGAQHGGYSWKWTGPVDEVPPVPATAWEPVMVTLDMLI